MKDAVTNYDRDLDIARDEALDYLQREFSCCGGSSYSDWESNRYFNCNSFVSPSCCGVPSSCCIKSRDEHCGDGVRSRSEESAAVVIYTQGCIVSVMRVFKDNVTVVAAISFSICLIEIICLILANVISRHIVLHRKLIS
ncbi:unnamed protein product [Lymnaea stagnalis]|uniref:Tetraspanin n=1 Tax=Lymnaea stagnalis TaxID=6523 RepID=A0AAV2HSQ7_LYMST